jgi:hypothetical protein
MATIAIPTVTFRRASWRSLLAARARILGLCDYAAEARELERQAQLDRDRDELAQPTMANPTAPGYRTQPRDGRGRFLPKAWLVRAETYTASDLAWFARPVST